MANFPLNPYYNIIKEFRGIVEGKKEMTISQFKSGKELMGKIQELQEFQKAFHDPYINIIRACAYDGQINKTKELEIKTDSELHKLIDDYVERQLSELKKHFDEI